MKGVEIRFKPVLGSPKEGMPAAGNGMPEDWVRNGIVNRIKSPYKNTYRS